MGIFYLFPAVFLIFSGKKIQIHIDLKFNICRCHFFEIFRRSIFDGKGRGQHTDGHKKHQTDDGHRKYRGVDLAAELAKDKAVQPLIIQLLNRHDNAKQQPGYRPEDQKCTHNSRDQDPFQTIQ